MTSAPYLAAADALYESGLGWPLPIPRGRKAPPPRGYTGAEGAEPDQARIAEWRASEGGSNVAVRLAPDLIGLDVDAYKNGVRDRWRSLVEAHGQLPATAYVSSRDDGSGIYLYRIDPQAARASHGVAAPGIEVVRYSHRYMVAPSSVHPEGRSYRWMAQPDDAAGLLCTTLVDELAGPPKAALLPELPRLWQAHLRSGEGCRCGLVAMPRTAPSPGSSPSRRESELWSPWQDQYRAPSRMRVDTRTPEDWLEMGMTALEGRSGSRHDAVTRAVMALACAEVGGNSEAARMIRDLGTAFVRAVTADESRTVLEAKREYERIESSARAKATPTP